MLALIVPVEPAMRRREARLSSCRRRPQPRQMRAAAMHRAAAMRRQRVSSVHVFRVKLHVKSRVRLAVRPGPTSWYVWRVSGAIDSMLCGRLF